MLVFRISESDLTLIDANLQDKLGYYVKWKGYEEQHNSWVSEEDASYVRIVLVVTSVLTMMITFLGTHRTLSRPTGRGSRKRMRRNLQAHESQRQRPVLPVLPRVRNVHRPTMSRVRQRLRRNVEGLQRRSPSLLTIHKRGERRPPRGPRLRRVGTPQVNRARLTQI